MFWKFEFEPIYLLHIIEAEILKYNMHHTSSRASSHKCKKFEIYLIKIWHDQVLFSDVTKAGDGSCLVLQMSYRRGDIASFF